MGLEGLVWKFYHISEAIMKVMYINLLWIAFTITGLGVFGIFPATAAMFAVTRKWMLGEKDIPVFRTFWDAYKSEFIQINILGYVLSILGIVLYVDLRFFQTSDLFLFQAISFLFIAFLFIYFVLLLFIFPVFVHFKYKTFDYIKYSLVMAVGRPLLSILMMIGCILVLFILKIMPALILFAGGGLMSVVLMWISMKSFPQKNAAES
ncbi:MAG TPA: YesL family protein [Bacillus sp. (in: firmicutes)]|uniref:YesL family protein n=1 Tax=Bacillus litorisediminis TaxID=2922713 RepID=UPI001FACCEE4|nr:YesL family protein [Bacillus litorisediminis]HWO75002.1 YesL family protein [Bacillus sp. (in: firmicutes)]